MRSIVIGFEFGPTVLTRDRLLTRLEEMGDTPDYVALAAEVLGIRNAPAALARRLVTQALVIEDRREAWLQAGARIAASAPAAPGVYVLRDADGQVLYVGKAINLRRRLRTHFAARRWRGLKAPLARAARAEWERVGSELMALLREAILIRDLRPIVNVQVGTPNGDRREIPSTLQRDVLVVLPSLTVEQADLVAARADGRWWHRRVERPGEQRPGDEDSPGALRDLSTVAVDLVTFFGAGGETGGGLQGCEDPLRLAPLVFSWLAQRGHAATRLDPRDWANADDLLGRLKNLLADDDLFTERLELR
jgi:predicted GIY-YIG superfamily endonuclease